MNPLLRTVEAMAFGTGVLAQANVDIAAMREARSEVSEAVSYEIALPAEGAAEYLLLRALPRLVYFLDCRGVKAPSSGGIFVSLFTASQLLFIEAGPLVQCLAEARCLTLSEVFRRYGANGVGDPALLGT
jgi:hypothetical protein